MSKYDDERKSLGIKPINSSSIKSAPIKSKYDDERNGIISNNNQIIPQVSNITPLPIKQSNVSEQPSWLVKKLIEHPSIMNALDYIVNNHVTKAVSGFGAGAEKGVGISYARRLLQPDLEKGMEETRKENPISSTIGELTGSILPFAKASKLAGKIPLINNLGTGAKSVIAKTALQEGIAGLGYGAVKGALDESTRDLKPNEERNILGNALKEAGDYGYYGGMFGGLASGLGQGISKLRTDKALKNIDNAYELMNKNLIDFKPKTATMQNPSLFTLKTIQKNQNSYKNPNTLKNEVAESLVMQPNNTGMVNSPTNTNSGLNASTTSNTISNGDFRIVSGQKKNTDSIYEKTKQKFSDLYTSWVNNENMLTKFDKASGDKSNIVSKTAMNAKKVNSTVENILTKDLVNKDGLVIGEGLQNILKDIPKNKVGDFEQYLLHKHNIDRFREGKVLDSGIDANTSVNKIAQYEKSNPEFIDLSKRINNFQNKFSQEWSVNSGLITQQLMNDLKAKYPNYVNSSREFSELEKGFNNVSSRAGFVDQPSGIKKATGSDRDIVSPLENIMNTVNRTVRSAKKNEVAQLILEKVQQYPQQLSKYAEILPSDYKGRLDLDNIVNVKVGGNDVHLKINDKRFLDTINKSADIDKSEGLAKVNNLFKGLITQYNPAFAVRNIFRDIPTSYIYGSENNPIKFARDLYKAGKEMRKNGVQSKQFDALGGGGANFFTPNESTAFVENLINSKSGLKSMPGKLLKSFELFNNVTEKLPRLAEFQRTLKKGGSVQDALYNSGETTVNFSRGGDKAKALDKKYVPYLNASIQGLDRFARGIKSNPIGFIGKSLTAITAPTVISEIWNRSVDPEGYKDLDNRTKDNYFVFAQGDGKFLKLPKSREIAVLFSSLFQRLYRAYNNEDGGVKESFKGFGNTIATNFSPTNPIENNILAPLALNLPKNKDFANRDIVPQYMKNLSPNLQYDEKTTEIAKWLGEQSTKIPMLEGGLSPKQIDYIIRSYTGVIGQMGIPLFTKSNTGGLLKPVTSQFMSDSVYSNQNVSDFYDNLNKLTTIAANRNVRENIPSNILTPEENLRGIFTKQANRMNKLRNIYKNGTEEEKRQVQRDIANISKNMNEILKK